MTSGLRLLGIGVTLVLLSFSPRAMAGPTSEAAKSELPYLRMSLVMNSAFHLVQLPLHLQGQLELSEQRAFVSFGGGLVYAGAAGLTFTGRRPFQHAGIYTFMGASILGAGVVGYGLVGCAARDESGCAVEYFNALNAFIFANQIVVWTLGVRQLTAERDRTTLALLRGVSVSPRPQGLELGWAGTF